MSAAILTGAEPQLFVADIAASCDFFTRALGFSVAFTTGNPPFYAQVRRDAAVLNLRCVAEPVQDAARSAREDLLAASITVAGADALQQLFRQFQAAGVGVHQGVRREPWGAMTFVIRDPDGNLLLFAGADK